MIIVKFKFFPIFVDGFLNLIKENQNYELNINSILIEFLNFYFKSLKIMFLNIIFLKLRILEVFILNQINEYKSIILKT